MGSWFKKRVKNFKKLHKNIKYIVNKSNTNYIIILFDIIYCKIVYMISSEEYKIYKFYNLNTTSRKKYLSKSKYKLIKNIHENKDILNIINNKEKLHFRFKDELNREVYNVNKLSYKEFEDIILENKNVLCRSIKSDFINSYKIFNLNDFRGPGFVLEKIKNDNLLLIEKCFNQNKTLNKISDNLVLIKAITIKGKVLFSMLSYKEGNNIINCYIDLKTMSTKGHLISNNSIYNEDIIDIKIPKLKEILDYCKKLSNELTEINDLEWSFALTDKNKIYLMDVCEFSEFEFVQIENGGIKDKYKKLYKN